MGEIEKELNKVSKKKKIKFVDLETGKTREIGQARLRYLWKQNERDGGKILWQYDEPAPGLAKPRTGDAVGKETGGDFESKNFVGEGKWTKDKSRAITYDEWSKIQSRARGLGKIGLMRINCQDKFIHWAIAEDDLMGLIEKARLYDSLSDEEKNPEPKMDKKLEYALMNAGRAIKNLITQLRKYGIDIEN